MAVKPDATRFGFTKRNVENSVVCRRDLVRDWGDGIGIGTGDGLL